MIPLAPVERSQSVVFPAVALLAFGTGLVTPSLRSLVSRRLSSGGQGAALGSLQGLQSLGSFLGPPLMGFSLRALGSQQSISAGRGLPNRRGCLER